jgi:hypothetical protein
MDERSVRGGLAGMILGVAAKEKETKKKSMKKLKAGRIEKAKRRKSDHAPSQTLKTRERAFGQGKAKDIDR